MFVKPCPDLAIEGAVMMNGVYRALISLATVLPISIPFVYVFADDLARIFPKPVIVCVSQIMDFSVFLVFLAIVVNCLIGFAFIWILEYFASLAGARPVKVETVRVLGADSILGYLPYVLPLFISQDDTQGLIGWLIGCCILFILSWVSTTIAFSPLLRLCGLQFYEVGLADGTTVTLLIRGARLRPLRLKAAVYISEYCIYGIR